MLMQKTTYYFSDHAIYTAFVACINAIRSELNTERAYNLNENVAIIENYDNHELIDSEMMINEHNLTDSIQSILESFDIIAVNIFINSEYVANRFAEIINKMKDQNINEIIECFSLKFEKNSDTSLLFNVLYARSIQSQLVDDIDETYIEYSDFDYESIFYVIETAISEIDPNVEISFDHTGGDVNSDIEYLDLYYHFKYDSEYLPSNDEKNDVWSVWVGNQTIEEFLADSTDSIENQVKNYVKSIPDMFRGDLPCEWYEIESFNAVITKLLIQYINTHSIIVKLKSWIGKPIVLFDQSKESFPDFYFVVNEKGIITRYIAADEITELTFDENKNCYIE